MADRNDLGHCFKPGHGGYVGPRCPLCVEVDRATGTGSFADAKRLYAEPADVSYTFEGETVTNRQGEIPDYVSAEDVFMADVFAEVRKARAAFPNNGSLVTGLALGEESGEAQRALLHILEGKSGEQPLYEECVQTAAMALRLALESADRSEWKGNVAKRIRDELDANRTRHGG